MGSASSSNVPDSAVSAASPKSVPEADQVRWPNVATSGGGSYAVWSPDLKEAEGVSPSEAPVLP